MNHNIINILLQITPHQLNKIGKHVKKAIGVVASEYCYAKHLKSKLEEADQVDCAQGRKKVAKALHILFWLSRGARRADHLEKDIIENLTKLKADLPPKLQQKEDELVEQLKIAESSIVGKASLFTGKLKKELKNIKTVEDLEWKYRKEPKKRDAIGKQLKLFFGTTKTDVSNVLKWLASTEVILKEVLDQIWEVRFSRRSFMKHVVGMGVAAIITFKMFPLLAQISKPKKTVKTKKIDARDFFNKILAEPSMEAFQKPFYSSDPNAKTIIVIQDAGHSSPAWSRDKLHILRKNLGLQFVGVEGWAGTEVDKKRGYQKINGTQELIRELMVDKRFELVGLEDRYLQDMAGKIVFVKAGVLPYLKSLEDDPNGDNPFSTTREMVEAMAKFVPTTTSRESMEKVFKEVVSYLGIYVNHPDNLFVRKRGKLVLNRKWTTGKVRKQMKRGYIKVVRHQRSKMSVNLMVNAMLTYKKTVGILLFGSFHTEGIVEELVSLGSFNVLALKSGESVPLDTSGYPYKEFKQVEKVWDEMEKSSKELWTKAKSLEKLITK